MNVALLVAVFMAFAMTFIQALPAEVGKQSDETKPEEHAAAPEAQQGVQAPAGGGDASPYKVMFGAAFTVILSHDWNTNGTWPNVPFDQVVLSTPKDLFNTNTSVFTPGTGQGGVWRFSASAQWKAQANSVAEMYLLKNGNIPIAISEIRSDSGSGYPTINADAVAYIGPQDTVEVQLYGGQFYGSTFYPWTVFSGTLVSRDWFPDTTN
jgi:type II secretory pathway pseudopilin PulG